MTQLTNRQLDQQDAVEAAIWELIENLNPKGTGVEWDKEVICQARDVIGDYFEANGVCTWQEFYPFIEIEDDQEEDDEEDLVA